MSNLLGSTETLVFLAIAVASFLGVGGSFLFGGHDHDAGGGGHEIAGADHSVPFLSPQIIFSFTLGFGASAAIASAYGAKLHWSILIGFAFGFLMAGAVYALYAVIYKQQATSLVETSNAIGKVANVLTAIPADGSGEIGLQVAGEYRTYLARSRQGEIAKGSRVKVIENLGGQLVVEAERT
jgi:membrane protein implicated in regulation of membrane protease activity